MSSPAPQAEFTQILLGVGSNLGDRRAAIENGLAHLTALLNLREVRRSRLYSTQPVGVTDQPDFLNMAVRAECDCTALELLAGCKATELHLGRMPRARWHARELDIDVLLFGTQRIQHPELEVPHPRMHARRFVLVPAAEIAGAMLHAGRTATVAQLLKDCTDRCQVELFGG